MVDRETWGPWAPNIPPAERVARFRALRALVRVLTGPGPLVVALARAETDPAAADEAAALLSRLPSLSRRRVLATYAALSRPVGSSPAGRVPGGAPAAVRADFPGAKVNATACCGRADCVNFAAQQYIA